MAAPELQTVADVRALRDARRTGGTDVVVIVRAILGTMGMTLRTSPLAADMIPTSPA